MASKHFTPILVAGLALFAMFFGAGNLIVPTMIGVQSGSVLYPAIIGFILTGVLLPALGIVASATSTTGVRGLTGRIGAKFGLIYTTIVFLSIGVLYAIPRVATVSYETSMKPFLASWGWDMAEGTAANGVAQAGFTLVFFAITTWLALSPSKLVERIGTWLTPALIVLLFILISVGVFTLNPVNIEATEKFTTGSPLVTGLIDGYSTMDAMASIVFGGIVIEALRRQGSNTRRKIFSSTIAAGLVAAFFLAFVYLGLGLLGARAEGTFENGAAALSSVSNHLFGPFGQIVFGLIVFLACLTTAIGLVGSSTAYFRKFFPQVSNTSMVLIHVAISLALSNLGLTLIMQIVVPLVLFTYPITIALIAVCLLDIVIPGRLNWTYKLPVWITAPISAWSGLRAIGWPENGLLAPIGRALTGEGSFLNNAWQALPLSAYDMAWMVPFALLLAVGLGIDIASGGLSRQVQSTPDAELEALPEPVGEGFQG